jgi:predicted enzyme related to lactoylglutathione lyase
METSISSMVTSYERGALSRRELIQGLAMLAAAGAAAASANASFAAPEPDSIVGLQAMTIDHISIHVSDLQRSVKFYQDVFGLAFLNEDKKTNTVRLKVGNGRIAVRKFDPAGVVDHFAFGVTKFDKAAVIDNMRKNGVTPLDTGEPLQFHVLDPDGYPVQIEQLAG